MFMIQQGPWKYIEFAYYPEGLLFNLDEDPREMNNRFNDPACVEILGALRTLLRTVVDPESHMERAFECQKRKLREITENCSVEEITIRLQSRLGLGQAATLAHCLKGSI